MPDFALTLPQSRSIRKLIPKTLDVPQAKAFLKTHIGAFYDVKVERMGKYGEFIVTAERKVKKGTHVHGLLSRDADLVACVRRLITTA
jgi:hypothetical protein